MPTDYKASAELLAGAVTAAADAFNDLTVPLDNLVDGICAKDDHYLLRRHANDLVMALDRLRAAIGGDITYVGDVAVTVGHLLHAYGDEATPAEVAACVMANGAFTPASD